MNADIWQELLQDSAADPTGNSLARTVTDFLEQGLLLLDHNGVCIYANRALREMTGYSAEELTSRPAHDLIHRHPVEASPFSKQECPLHRTCANPALPLKNHEFILFRKDGTPFEAYCTAQPIKRSDEEILCLLLEIRDITADKRAQSRKLTENVTFRLAVDAARIGTWERDLHDDKVTISAVTAQILGLPARETILPASEWQAAVVPEDLPLLEEVFHQAGLDQPFEMEFRIRRFDQRIIWVTSRGIVQGGPQDQAARALGVMIDITERKHAEEALRASEERFRMLAELSPDGILVSQDNVYVYANQSAAQILGSDNVADIIGRSIFDLIDPEFHDRIRARKALPLEEKQNTPLSELRYLALNGSVVHGQVRTREVFWESRPATQILLRDVTELKQSREKVQRLSERLQIAIEGIGEAIWDWDIAHNTFTFSGGLNKILERAEDDSAGTELEWRRAIHPDDRQRVVSAFQANIEGKTPVYECEYRLRAKDGSWKWVRARGAIVERNRDGTPRVMTGTMIDITAKKQSDELAWRHANLDPLTGLPNRRLFRDQLEHELLMAKRRDCQLALLFLDLDGFKQVNDLLGHDTGDLLLMEAGRRIKNCVRGTDTVARLGGDEFTVVLTDLDNRGHIEFVCQKILTSLSEPFNSGNELSYVSASIGVSLFPMDGTIAGEMLRKADQAMYAAKHAGKNQFSYFTREMDDKAHARLRITNELRHALQQRQLTVVYQPVVHLATGRIVKAEALLRWHHPKLGDVQPSEFIPMAEESGLIQQIGDWVFQEAASCCKRCTEQLGIPFQIGVNKSPVQFMARESDANWLQYLTDRGMPGSSISIEITEGVLLQAAPQIVEKLLEYRDAGIEVAIDDFGTGYSSMSYLRKFHIDYVKIDQSFVQDISADPNSRTIAETIIVMAHKLGQKVIAEGVETQEQFERLAEAGCDYGQGFFFSVPVPADKLVQMMTRKPSSFKFN